VAFGLTVAWVLGVGGVWVDDGLGSRGWDFLVAFRLTVAWVLVSAWWWSRGFAVGLGFAVVLGFAVGLGLPWDWVCRGSWESTAKKKIEMRREKREMRREKKN
jgi:hypothetical protein